jgi:hypothetical protein
MDLYQCFVRFLLAPLFFGAISPEIVFVTVFFDFFEMKGMSALLQHT